jgi:hypothetical protein
MGLPLLLSTIPAHRASRSLLVILYPTLVRLNTIQHTTIYQQTTTNSPAKNHAQPTIFLKIPCKNHPPPSQKKNHSRGSSILSNTRAI